jgi:pyrroline-5-carboxylate reductase
MVSYELGVIGAGNMAEALLRGVTASGFIPAGAIVAADPSAERRELLSGKLAVTCVADNAAAAACPRVLLAVKPQVMAEVLAAVAPTVRPDALVISIAAGVTTTMLDNRLGGRGRIVRVMPNTPMLVGAGISAVAAGPRAGDDDVAWTCDLFATSGEVVRVGEEMMDAVTAVSGSGPAYFFYLVEAMIAAGLAEGLDERTAARLAGHTCLGAGRLLADTGESAAALRARVTSPGGTTQRAVETMDAAGAKDILVRAVRAAAARARELGK